LCICLAKSDIERTLCQKRQQSIISKQQNITNSRHNTKGGCEANQAGKRETAAQHAHLARGQDEHHAAGAAKAHVEDYGKASAARA